MSQHVLLMNGKVIPVQTLRSLTAAEIDSELEKNKRNEFDQNVKRLYGTYMSVPPNWTNRRRKANDGAQYIDDSNEGNDDDDDDVDPSFGNEKMLKQNSHSMPQADNVCRTSGMVG